jgi:signal peptidase I
MLGPVIAVVAAVLLLAGAVVLLLTGAAWWFLVYCAVLALVLGLGFVAFARSGRVLVAVTIRGASMEPTYRDNDSVLVRRTTCLTVGQVVVVEKPTIGAEWLTPAVRAADKATAVSSREWLIKRVAAVPGDPVAPGMNPSLAAMAGPVVPAGKLILLGDNRKASFDSRIAGYFPVERVLGVVLRRLDR